MSRYDVVIVGSGVAGLTCALTAARRGASVIVLEAAPVVGGTSAISGGAVWLPGTRLAEAGDSSAAVESYLRSITLGLVSEDVLQAFIQWAPDAFAFLEAETAITFEPTGTPDYRVAPGARTGGRSLGPLLYDTKRLGSHKALLREVTGGGISPVTHAEQMHGSVGVDPEFRVLVEKRLAEGITARGNALVAALFEACLESQIKFVCSARASGLLRDENRVKGVRVEREGATENLSARLAVVLASGGYEWDQRLWAGLTSKPLDWPLSPPFNRGDALRMAVEAGARLEHTSLAWWMPSIRIDREEVDGVPSGRMFPLYKGLPGAIAVNGHGRRYANEAMNYHDFGLAMTTFDPHTFTFPNATTWVVMDDRHFRTYGLEAASAQFGESWLKSAPTLKALAEKIGVDATSLEDEVREFNISAERHVDPKFHRGEAPWDVYRGDPAFPNPALAPLGAGPYYAYRQYVGCLGTKGGAAVDGKARVLDFDDQPIAGLFAVGNAAAATFGPAYPGAGATLGAGATFGYVAGLTAAS